MWWIVYYTYLYTIFNIEYVVFIKCRTYNVITSCVIYMFSGFWSVVSYIDVEVYSISYPIGSMVLVYMVTWIPSIYPLYVTINIPAPWIRHGFCFMNRILGTKDGLAWSCWAPEALLGHLTGGGSLGSKWSLLSAIPEMEWNVVGGT